MIEDGLKPTPEDIIRLNALGVKYENSASPAGVIYRMPRVAYLGKLSFREPTLGHRAWIDRVCTYCDDNLSTSLAVHAFALSRPTEALPDPNDRDATNKAISSFIEKDAAALTVTQLKCAVVYATYGASDTEQEYPPDRDDPNGVISEDVAISVGVGVLFDTISVGLGVSVRDICNMTIAQANALRALALIRSNFDLTKSVKESALGDYIATKHEIIARLKAEAK